MLFLSKLLNFFQRVSKYFIDFVCVKFIIKNKVYCEIQCNKIYSVPNTKHWSFEPDGGIQLSGNSHHSNQYCACACDAIVNLKFVT